MSNKSFAVLRYPLTFSKLEPAFFDSAAASIPERVPSTFLICLFNDLINKFGRDYIFKQIDVKNLSNYSDYSRVVLGTAFQQ